MVDSRLLLILFLLSLQLVLASAVEPRVTRTDAEGNIWQESNEVSPLELSRMIVEDHRDAVGPISLVLYEGSLESLSLKKIREGPHSDTIWVTTSHKGAVPAIPSGATREEIATIVSEETSFFLLFPTPESLCLVDKALLEDRVDWALNRRIPSSTARAELSYAESARLLVEEHGGWRSNFLQEGVDDREFRVWEVVPAEPTVRSLLVSSVVARNQASDKPLLRGTVYLHVHPHRDVRQPPVRDKKPSNGPEEGVGNPDMEESSVVSISGWHMTLLLGGP
ncbi:MAG: hypothetical protein KF858_09010 [Candidatus Sumerlaeia bacterium]|nr:hypothetical protein [Candidatus Sumerlaeia bacterium]